MSSGQYVTAPVCTRDLPDELRTYASTDVLDRIVHETQR